MPTKPWTSLLQFSDGLFPAGAYAHSFGLEWYVQAGIVSDAASLEALLRSYLEASVAPTDARTLLRVWTAATEEDMDRCLRLDAMVDALKPAEELRNASRQMGRQTLRTANTLLDHPLVRNFYGKVEECQTPGHHPVAMGLVGAALAWEPKEMISAYLYSSSAALVNAALRLFPLGQLAGQRILWNLQPLFEHLSADLMENCEEELWSFTPALEIAAMRHSTLDARLFRS